MNKFLSQFPDKLIVIFFILLGITAGLAAYAIYASRAYSYLLDDPAACINCHVMVPSYQSWSRTSHAQWATCNDCHVPHDNILRKYAFKAKDGLRHAAMFTFDVIPQAPRPTAESSSVIMENCVRCHTQLNTALVKTGTVAYADTQHGQGKACWDCHRQVPHTNISGLSSAPNAIVPIPTKEHSNVADWLKNK